MRIDIWSDVVCPWCYVGKRRLERALRDFRHAGTVELRHRAFQLDPAAPKDRTRSRRELLKAKYRLSDGQVLALDERMAAVAADEGLSYRAADGLTGNTEDAHRLLRLAAAQGRESALLDRFYHAYFAEGRSLFDAAALTPLAVEAGLDEPAVARVLTSDDYAGAVREDRERARDLGVTGVPFFLVDGRLAVQGAQAVPLFRDVLERAWSDNPPPEAGAGDPRQDDVSS